MLGDAIGTFAAAKETSWNYELPEFDRPVASASVGVDGTCMLLRDDGWRVAMTGTIALYDSQGERLHTIYLGATPEYGKAPPRVCWKKWRSSPPRIRFAR